MHLKPVPDRFESFILAIDQHRAQHEALYFVRLVESPVGSRTPEAIDLRDLDLGPMAFDDGGGLGSASRSDRLGIKRHLGVGDLGEEDVKQLGKALFQKVFVGALGEAFRSAVERVLSRDCGLSVQLLLDGAPELAGLPWEALWDPGEGAFLEDQPHLLISRTLPVPLAEISDTLASPLGLLALLPQPTSEVELSGQSEWEEIGQHLQSLIQAGVLRHDQVQPPTLQGLAAKLDDHAYQVLHVVSHGLPGGDGSGGTLSLEDDGGALDNVTGGDFTRALERHGALRLVVLNVCFGGYGPSDDPFDGLAQALLKRGIPAVVAMRSEISDAAAVAFASAFYRALAEGRTFEAAMSEARRALAVGKFRAEWATPVLFLRGTNLRLFETPEEPKPKRTRQLIGVLTAVALMFWGYAIELSRGWPLDVVSWSKIDIAIDESSNPEPPPDSLDDDRPVAPAYRVPWLAPIPGKVAILVINKGSQEFDHRVADALEAAFSEDPYNLSPFVPRTDFETIERLLSGQMQSFSNGKTAWGVEYLLLASSNRRDLPQSQPHLVGTSLNLNMRLVSAADGSVETQKSLTHNGLSTTEEGALLQAAGRCLREFGNFWI